MRIGWPWLVPALWAAMACAQGVAEQNEMVVGGGQHEVIAPSPEPHGVEIRPGHSAADGQEYEVVVPPTPDFQRVLNGTGSGFAPASGLADLAEIILESDVIARVEYRNRQSSVVQTTIGWLAMLEFRFEVHEYLKGSGPDVIGGLIFGGYETEAQAERGKALMADAHDNRWNDREAIVFLNYVDEREWPLHQLGPGQYWLAYAGGSHDGYRDRYSVASHRSKLWLPEATQTGDRGSSTSGQSSKATTTQLFMLDAPTGGTGASGERSASNTGGGPTISLSDLKGRIAALEAEASAGGTPEYRHCVERYHNALRRIRQSIEARGYVAWQHDRSIDSGMPTGTVVDEYPGRLARSPDATGRSWYGGPDGALMGFNNVRFTTSARDAPYIRYTAQLVTARPLPAGTYTFYPNWLPPDILICGKDWSFGANRVLFRLAVTPSTNTLHEAFFDPVAIGSGVGADGTDGVLKPNAFSLDGTTTTISSLKWEGGAVTMTLSPSASLAGYAVDFIALDGSVTSTLAFDDATQSGGTLTWSVTDKPWNAGDLLMLRIAAKPSIAISGLDASIEAGQTDAFTVSASNLVAANSYTIRVSTDGANIGFDTTCADRQEDTTVPAASTSHDAAFTLRACSTTGGTVTATLLEGTTAVATATQDVTVTAPPPPPPNAPAPTGLSVVTTTQTTIRVSWNTVQDAHRYRLERSADGSSGWSNVDDGISGTSHMLSGLSCATTVHFRVSARGDGSPYSTTFGSPSTSVSGTTGACTSTTTPVATPVPTPTTPSPPAFASSTYSFTVAENAPAFHVVGIVSADDPDGGIVTYSIVAGNAGGKFNITHNDGLIVVRGSLDYDATSSYALTVRATDSSGATSTAVVNISITKAP